MNTRTIKNGDKVRDSEHPEDKVISTTYQAGKDAAVEYIEKSFTFSLDELSKSGAEKLKDVLNQARSV